MDREFSPDLSAIAQPDLRPGEIVPVRSAAGDRLRHDRPTSQVRTLALIASRSPEVLRVDVDLPSGHGASIMSLETHRAAEPDFPLAIELSTPQARQQALAADLQAALAREQGLLGRIAALESRQDLQICELNHRLFNGLQSIASLLSAQGRVATPEAAADLAIAASRIVAFGQVNRRLHWLDRQDRVEFSGYLTQLCGDLSALLRQPGFAIEAAPLELPTATAIPLSFIVNELITNAVKYAAGRITIALQPVSPSSYTLSVTDQGPGLPAGFDPAAGKGLGMRIVQGLVAQIGGELSIAAGEDGRGARFAVRFTLPAAGCSAA